MTEKWLAVVGYEGFYEVSDRGRVRNASGLILKDRIYRDGYNHAVLCVRNHRRSFMVHRLVAAAFIGPIPDGLEVNHINAKRADNYVENLEYVTRKQNILHSCALGNIRSGERHGRARLTQEQVATIRKRREAGETYRALAEEYGVHKNTARMAALGETWRT
jgi:hypothetical protein